MLTKTREHLSVAILLVMAALVGLATVGLGLFLIGPAHAAEPVRPRVVVDCGSLVGEGSVSWTVGDTTFRTRVNCGVSA